MKIKKQEFNDDDVELDGNEFEDCTFKNCDLVFRARAPVSLNRCELYDCRWSFRDAAALTTGFLHGMTSMTGDFGRAMLINTFPVLRDWLSDDAKAKLAQPRISSGERQS